MLAKCWYYAMRTDSKREAFLRVRGVCVRVYIDQRPVIKRDLFIFMLNIDTDYFPFVFCINIILKNENALCKFAGGMYAKNLIQQSKDQSFASPPLSLPKSTAQ